MCVSKECFLGVKVRLIRQGSRAFTTGVTPIMSLSLKVEVDDPPLFYNNDTRSQLIVN